MVRQVTAFAADDGTVFASRERAAHHDMMKEITKQIGDVFAVSFNQDLVTVLRVVKQYLADSEPANIGHLQ